MIATVLREVLQSLDLRYPGPGTRNWPFHGRLGPDHTIFCQCDGPQRSIAPGACMEGVGPEPLCVRRIVS